MPRVLETEHHGKHAKSLRVGAICAAVAHAVVLRARTRFAVLALKTVGEPRQHVNVPVRQCSPGWIAYSSSIRRVVLKLRRSQILRQIQRSMFPTTRLDAYRRVKNGATHHPQQKLWTYIMTGFHKSIPRRMFSYGHQ